MNFFYKVGLYLNLLKHSIKYEYQKKYENKYILFLKNYFNRKKKGFYIDVGSYHPIRLSNTKFLYDKGWQGINIDISKKSIDLFKIARKTDINLNIGIGNKNEFSDAYFQKDLFHSNTLVYEHSKKFLANAIKKKIKTLTLDSVINRYAKNKKIDYIDIDCEGKDLEVLQGLNLGQYQIDLISIEMHGYDTITKKRAELIFDIMKKNKFKKIYGNYPDTLIFKKF
jgi:FkbM family methyltransferase